MSTKAQLDARAARFAGKPREVIPVQKKVMAHYGGKMTTNKAAATKKFLARKQLSAQQLKEMKDREARLATSRTPLADKQPQQGNTTQATNKPTKQEQLQKQLKKLTKKLREIKMLESGEKELDTNQKAKVARKAEIEDKAAQLQADLAATSC